MLVAVALALALTAANAAYCNGKVVHLPPS